MLAVLDLASYTNTRGYRLFFTPRWFTNRRRAKSGSESQNKRDWICIAVLLLESCQLAACVAASFCSSTSARPDVRLEWYTDTQVGELQRHQAFLMRKLASGRTLPSLFIGTCRVSFGAPTPDQTNSACFCAVSSFFNYGGRNYNPLDINISYTHDTTTHGTSLHYQLVKFVLSAA